MLTFDDSNTFDTLLSRLEVLDKEHQFTQKFLRDRRRLLQAIKKEAHESIKEFLNDKEDDSLELL